MIAIDSSTLIAYLSGAAGTDVEVLDLVLAEKRAVVPPVVIAELLSDAKLTLVVRRLLRELPLLPILDGFWGRTGSLRATILAKGHRAPLADSLIAQSCLDHKVPLLTRDHDFQSYSKWGGLSLA